METDNTPNSVATKLQLHRKSLRWLAGTVWAIVGIVLSIGGRHGDIGFAFVAFALAAVQIILGFSNSPAPETPANEQASSGWKDVRGFALAALIGVGGYPFKGSDGANGLAALLLGLITLALLLSAF